MSRQNKNKRNSAIAKSFGKGKVGPARTTSKRGNVKRVIVSDKDRLNNLNTYRKDLKMNGIGSFADLRLANTFN